MAITSIKRDIVGNPNIVRIETTDDLTEITTNNYLVTQQANIRAINKGDFEWTDTDLILINFDGGDSFFTRNADAETFVLNNAPAGSITNSQIANDAAISYSKIAANNILQTSSTTVTAAQFKGAFAAPVLLLPPPGTGIAYFLESVVISMDYTGPAYAGGDDVVVLYGAITGNPAASEPITAANFYATADSVFSAKAADLNVTKASIAGEALYLTNDTTAFTAGNSSFTVTIWYRQLLLP